MSFISFKLFQNIIVAILISHIIVFFKSHNQNISSCNLLYVSNSYLPFQAHCKLNTCQISLIPSVKQIQIWGMQVNCPVSKVSDVRLFLVSHFGTQLKTFHKLWLLCFIIKRIIGELSQLEKWWISQRSTAFSFHNLSHSETKSLCLRTISLHLVSIFCWWHCELLHNLSCWQIRERNCKCVATGQLCLRKRWHFGMIWPAETIQSEQLTSLLQGKTTIRTCLQLVVALLPWVSNHNKVTWEDLSVP